MKFCQLTKYLGTIYPWQLLWDSCGVVDNGNSEYIRNGGLKLWRIAKRVVFVASVN